MESLKNFALPRRVGEGVLNMPRCLGGFDIVYRGQPKVTMDPKSDQFPHQKVINVCIHSVFDGAGSIL